MSSKGESEITIISSTINTEIYIQISDSFLIPPSEENKFGDKEIDFQDVNTSSHKAKRIKTFLPKCPVKSIKCPAYNPDLNPIENLWWKLKKLLHEKTPTSLGGFVKSYSRKPEER